MKKKKKSHFFFVVVCKYRPNSLKVRTLLFKILYMNNNKLMFIKYFMPRDIGTN